MKYSKEAVFDALKSRNFKVAEMGEVLGKSRQSIYNYVNSYVDSSQGQLPAFLHRLFSMCMNPEITQEQIDAFWGAYTKRITEIIKKVENARRALEDWDSMQNAVDNNMTVEIEGVSDPEELRSLIATNYNKFSVELNHHESELAYERSELLNRPMSDFDPSVSAKVDKLSRPVWQGAEVETVCVANSGNYMVIVNPESNAGVVATKLKLFATINDASVYLKTMDFEAGSNMIQFSLIPQFVYRYEVVQITENGVKTSGGLDLKNYI